MSIERHFQPVGGLPSPHGALASSLSPRAIVRANTEVEKVLREVKDQKRLGRYQIYTAQKHVLLLVGMPISTEYLLPLVFFSEKIKAPCLNEYGFIDKEGVHDVLIFSLSE